jgi:hypothetical protein
LGDVFYTSNVTNMRAMFQNTGASSTAFVLDLGDNFNTINVEDMTNMFYKTGYSSTKFTLNCSNWNVEKVTKRDAFNTYVASKVTPPKWVN